MREIVILSPHRDDAAFSLCLSTLRWTESGTPIRVLNLFTQSSYAPRAAVAEDGLERSHAVSLVRAKEDLAVLAAIDPAIKVQSLDFVDAPLRLGIEANAVCTERARLLSDSDTIERLSAAISRRIRGDAVLAPLGLGGHVDHLAVRSAAIIGCRGSKALGFYEDLPYAIWTSEKTLSERVREVESQTGVALRPLIIRECRAIWKKRKIVSGYKSQISAREADEIARFASRYQGGERIWISKRSLWPRPA